MSERLRREKPLLELWKQTQVSLLDESGTPVLQGGEDVREMILPPEPPLKLAEHDRDWVQSHLFYTQFCTYAKDMQIDNLFDRLKAIQPHFWEAARTHFPDEWQALSLLQKNLFDTIETLMAQTIDQLEDFKISVKRLTGLKEES